MNLLGITLDEKNKKTHKNLKGDQKLLLLNATFEKLLCEIYGVQFAIDGNFRCFEYNAVLFSIEDGVLFLPRTTHKFNQFLFYLVNKINSNVR